MIRHSGNSAGMPDDVIFGLEFTQSDINMLQGGWSNRNFQTYRTGGTI